mmetsp:Transcript_20969/g.48697  ORF Transcript_20969/g.48697 Transcript_20969/m.48697 type:complete len:232 (-) Transcript_20969:96-791(-)
MQYAPDDDDDDKTYTFFQFHHREATRKALFRLRHAGAFQQLGMFRRRSFGNGDKSNGTARLVGLLVFLRAGCCWFDNGRFPQQRFGIVQSHLGFGMNNGRGKNGGIFFFAQGLFDGIKIKERRGDRRSVVVVGDLIFGCGYGCWSNHGTLHVVGSKGVETRCFLLFSSRCLALGTTTAADGHFRWRLLLLLLLLWLFFGCGRHGWFASSSAMARIGTIASVAVLRLRLTHG